MIFHSRCRSEGFLPRFGKRKRKQVKTMCGTVIRCCVGQFGRLRHVSAQIRPDLVWTPPACDRVQPPVTAAFPLERHVRSVDAFGLMEFVCFGSDLPSGGCMLDIVRETPVALAGIGIAKFGGAPEIVSFGDYWPTPLGPDWANRQQPRQNWPQVG